MSDKQALIAESLVKAVELNAMSQGYVVLDNNNLVYTIKHEEKL